MIGVVDAVLDAVVECICHLRPLALIEPCPRVPGRFDILYERGDLVCMACQPDLESARRFARELGFEFVEVADREAA